MGNSSAILCGYQWAGCKALDVLLERFDNVYVYTHESPYYAADLIALCDERGVRYSTDKITADNLPFEPDIICSVYYRYLIGAPVIAAADGKIFNLHPSLLPKYRGCSSLTWAMINREPSTGYTYHYVDEGCDTGDIIVQQTLPIESWDTQQSLYQRAMERALTDFDAVIDHVLAKKVGQPQSGESTYYPRGCPHDGVICDDWSEEQIKAFIKAMINPPLPVASYHGTPVTSYQMYLELKEAHQ